MIREYGGKRVIYSKLQYEGLIIELKGECLVARQYYKNEYNTYLPEETYTIIDSISLKNKKTELSKIREISKQLKTGNYVISEEVVEKLEKK